MSVDPVGRILQPCVVRMEPGSFGSHLPGTSSLRGCLFWRGQGRGILTRMGVVPGRRLMGREPGSRWHLALCTFRGCHGSHRHRGCPRCNLGGAGGDCGRGCLRIFVVVILPKTESRLGIGQATGWGGATPPDGLSRGCQTGVVTSGVGWSGGRDCHQGIYGGGHWGTSVGAVTVYQWITRAVGGVGGHRGWWGPVSADPLGGYMKRDPVSAYRVNTTVGLYRAMW